MMGQKFVELHIPNIKNIMDVAVLNGSFNYNMPDNSTDTFKISACDSSLEFVSKNHYNNSSISLIAADKDMLEYGLVSYPNYFTKTNDGFQYKNGTETNQIDITLTGYTSVDFIEESK